MNNSYGQMYNPNYIPGFTQPNPCFSNPVPMVQPTAQSVQRLYGRTINTIEEVKPQEVPMDGSVGIFPLSDCSKIYVKYWDTNGRIQTEVYERQAKPEEPTPINTLAAVMERFDKLEKLLGIETGGGEA